MQITQAQIQAVGDQAINWAKGKLGTGAIPTAITDYIQKEWDTAGVAEVAKLMTDLGWTVTTE